MSLLFRRDLGDTPNQLIPQRSLSFGTVTVNASSALSSSAVWACLRLRADLLSTLPLTTYRQVGDLQLKVPPSPFITNPAGDAFGAMDWLYASQIDLDRAGNAFGVIAVKDALGYPSVVELVDRNTVTVKGRGSQITGYRIAGRNYAPSEVWHERQFPVPGIPLGLSPIGHAAMTISAHLSAQEFAVNWFRNGGIPSGRLKNIAKTIDTNEARIAKDRFKEATAARDLFVHGADWEYEMLSVPANESQFIETMNASIMDIARFFGVPGDMIDAPAQSSAKITYANITQRHLQFLVTSLGPTLRRREASFSAALPKPRFAKFNADDFLRMDPASLAAFLGKQVADRLITPSEARTALDRLPFTEADLAEFDRLFGTKQPAPGMSTGVAP